jgi:RNA-splicing ligase RtcB
MFPDWKVFCENLEATALQQIYGFLQHEAFSGQKIRIMPDAHAGAGAVIGFTSTLSDKVIPNVIGVDISCGINAYLLDDIEIDFQSLDDFIREKIPSGCRVRDKVANRQLLDRANASLNIDMLSGELLELFSKVAEETNQKPQYVINSIGSLGRGNHFLEIGRSGAKTYLTIHSGSRNFGLKIALFHQKKAKLKTNKGDLSYLEGDDALLYFEHMKVASWFAGLNREIMARSIVSDFFKMNDYVQKIESIHNYIDFKHNVIRKGAIAAHRDQMVVIPWNMRDGLIIGRGKGNEDWNNSAPHGAGRLMGRRVAKESIALEDFKASMEGIWTSCVHASTLDESPMAYKDFESIEAQLTDTVEVLERVKPLYNFKASE